MLLPSKSSDALGANNPSSDQTISRCVTGEDLIPIRCSSAKRRREVDLRDLVALIRKCNYKSGAFVHSAIDSYSALMPLDNTARN